MNRREFLLASAAGLASVSQPLLADDGKHPYPLPTTTEELRKFIEGWYTLKGETVRAFVEVPHIDIPPMTYMRIPVATFRLGCSEPQAEAMLCRTAAMDLMKSGLHWAPLYWRRRPTFTIYNDWTDDFNGTGQQIGILYFRIAVPGLARSDGEWQPLRRIGTQS